jgi:hypothetical protein
MRVMSRPIGGLSPLTSTDPVSTSDCFIIEVSRSGLPTFFTKIVVTGAVPSSSANWRHLEQ